MEISVESHKAVFFGQDPFDGLQQRKSAHRKLYMTGYYTCEMYVTYEAEEDQQLQSRKTVCSIWWKQVFLMCNHLYRRYLPTHQLVPYWCRDQRWPVFSLALKCSLRADPPQTRNWTVHYRLFLSRTSDKMQTFTKSGWSNNFWVSNDKAFKDTGK